MLQTVALALYLLGTATAARIIRAARVAAIVAAVTVCAVGCIGGRGPAVSGHPAAVNGHRIERPLVHRSEHGRGPTADGLCFADCGRAD